MNILFVAPRLPLPADTGGKIRTLNILRQLAKKAKVHLVCYSFDADDKRMSQDLSNAGIEVTLVPAPTMGTISKVGHVLFNPLPVSIAKYYSDDMEATLKELNETNQFDAVHVDHLHMAHYQSCFDGIPCVIDEHNVEYKILERCANVEKSFIRRMVFKNQARKMKEFESDRVKEFSAYLAVSKDDKDLLDDLGGDPGNGYVIPNGVDTQYFKLQDTGHKAQGEEEAVVFTGSMDWLPNDDAAIYFCQDILPLLWKEKPRLKFYIVGKNPSSKLKEYAQSDDRIVLTGRVDDVRTYVEKSKIFVVPLRIGGGTRLKILEAMSMQRVVVSTTVGAEGIACQDGHDIIIADKPEDFSKRILTLLNDQSFLQKVSLAGLELVNNHYDWDIVGSALFNVYEKYKA